MDSLERWIRRLGVTAGVIFVALYVTFCAYSLPSTAKVHVTGTEIKRHDVERADGTIRSNDVRYIIAEDLEGRPRMFRNEDTGFGWPPYFKFDSGDLAAQATNLSKEGVDPVVLIRYYGFRIHMLSLFPNALSMKTVDRDYQATPWLTILVAILHVVLIAYGVYRIRRFLDRRSGGEEGAEPP